MKKRIVAILLIIILALSGSTMAWAAPEGEGIGDEVLRQDGNAESEGEIEEDAGLIDEGEDNLLGDEDGSGETEETTVLVNETATQEDGSIVLENELQVADTGNENNGNLFAGGTGTAEDPFQITTA